MNATLATTTPERVGQPYRASDDLDGFDAIVIGSGLGSLTAAAVLARRASRRVLVLERHYTPGGFTHVFKRPGCEWDVGLHYVGDLWNEDAGLAPLLDYITEGRVDWAPMGPVYDRTLCQGETFDFVAGAEAFAAELTRRFPSDQRAIARYVRLLERCQSASRAYFVEKALPSWLAKLLGTALRFPFLRFARHTTYETLRALTDNEKLIGVLTTQWGDYGLPPRASSFGAHAIVASHYLGGAAYPMGGASRIAAAVQRVIAAAGGRLVIRAEVRSILVEGGAAVGVELVDGRHIRAPLVISGVGVRRTIGTLLAPANAVRLGLNTALTRIEPSCAMLCLFVALDGTDRELGLATTNLWIHRTFDHDADMSGYLADPSLPFPTVYFSFQSAKDPTFNKRYPRTAALQVLVPASYAWFRPWEKTRWKHRGAAHDAFKQELSERLLEKLYEHVPQTRGRVKHAELGTPLSTQHFANHPQGEAYGLAHTPERFLQRALRPQTAIRSLYLTGVDIALCGIGGALASGYLTASAALGRNAMAAALHR
jgi:all-trans-retinol 13,14-reductase